jgi:hypothetical protein
MPHDARRKDSQVRNRYRANIALALGVVAALGVTLPLRGGPAGTTGGGDFIVRCFFTGPTESMDPILDPNSSNADHLHIFFGNLIQGTPGFPSIKSGDSTPGTTMESNGQSPQTNCQDTEDTAGYWMPAPYVNGQAYAAGGPCTSSTCNVAATMHLRVYYLPTVGSVQYDEIPDGTIMVTGYPDGCMKDTTVTPPGCTYDGNGNPNPSYPDHTSLVRYTCGDSAHNTIMTPVSAWPYDCANYRDGDDSSFNDGIVAIVDFPQCWNGHADWPAPNDSGRMVPGFVAPWIPDPGAPPNDFAYATGGSCPPTGMSSYSIPVVQLEERFHLLTTTYADESAFGQPSTCFGRPNDAGPNWNSLDNAENSPTTTDTETPTDNDSTVQVSTNPVVWGYFKCVPASGPVTTSDLSFACTHSTVMPLGDSNCNVPLSVPKTCKGGTCWIGASQYGFETLHADYWQTWQEGTGDMQGVGTDPNSSPGYFRDLVEDCTNNGTSGCAFINNTMQPPIPKGRVFPTPSTTSPESPP